MESVEYCEETWIRLTAWKAKLFDVVQVAEHFHSPGKKVIDPELKKLMLTIDTIGKKLAEYRSLCKEAAVQEKQTVEDEAGIQKE